MAKFARHKFLRKRNRKTAAFDTSNEADDPAVVVIVAIEGKRSRGRAYIRIYVRRRGGSKKKQPP